MTRLIDPGLPPEHPRSKYLHNLEHGQCVTWYSSTRSLRELLMEVLALVEVEVEFNDLKFDELGFAGNDNVMITALHGPMGSVVSVWAVGDRGTAMLNGAIQAEMDRISSELSLGEYVGHDEGGVVTIVHGETTGHFMFSSPEAFDFINTAEVISVYDTWALKDGLAERGFTM